MSNKYTGAPSNHYGIFNLLYEPKPIVAAINNLRKIMAPTAFTAQVPVPVTITGASSIVIQNGANHYSILVWVDAPTGSAVFTPTGQISGANVYDPFVGTAIQHGLSTTAPSAVALTGHPIVINVSK